MTQDLKPSEVLAKAADLIEPDGAWIQGGSSKDAEGRWLGAGGAAGPKAVCWCAIGALLRCGMLASDTTPLDYLREVVASPIGVGGWNDCEDRTQAEVVAAFRKAAAVAAEAGQ